MSVLLSLRPFALNDLDDYEKHFTVMNYDPDVVLKQVASGGAPEQVQVLAITVRVCILSGSLSQSVKELPVLKMERQGSLVPRQVSGVRSLSGALPHSGYSEVCMPGLTAAEHLGQRGASTRSYLTLGVAGKGS